MINNRTNSNGQALISITPFNFTILGDVKTNFHFSMNFTSHVDQFTADISCSAILHGEFYIIGDTRPVGDDIS